MSEPQLILLVEDNEVNQMLTSAVLERDGYRVQVAGSAEEAMECLARDIPTLILTDVQLPGQDGLQLTRTLKSTAATANIPIVALTALAMVGDRESALAAGCDGYISKPIDTRLFGEQIRKFIR